MDSIFNFLVEPLGDRYNNTVDVDGKELIVNTEIFNHRFVNREAIVKSVPEAFKTDIKVGDIVVLHHNVFRRWHDVRGIERNGAAYVSDNLYTVAMHQIYAYKTSLSDDWKAVPGFCFVQPIKNENIFVNSIENEMVGFLVYADGKYGLEVGDLVGIGPSSQFEFILDNKLLYRVRTQDISIKYDLKGTERRHNPEWAK
jgi:hypothetical protein